MNGDILPEERFSKRGSLSSSYKVDSQRALQNLLQYEDSDSDRDLDPIEDIAEEADAPTSHQRNVGQWTVISFINSASGGGMGLKIAKNLGVLLGENSVFDLKSCKKGNMPEDILANFALDPNVRVLVCGGDGTMGWILSSIDKLWRKRFGSNYYTTPQYEKVKHHLPIAIMPLGTGNDLSRMFKWGPLFQKHMKKKPMIQKIQNAPATVLDRWRCVVIPIARIDEECRQWIPAVLAGRKLNEMEDKSFGSFNSFLQDTSNRRLMVEHPEQPQDSSGRNALSKFKRAAKQVVVTNRVANKSSEVFDGVFCNYASFGFDANVAFEFHKEREQHRERFTSPTKNKMIYLEKSFSSGGLMAFRESKKPPLLKEKIRVVVHNMKTNKMEVVKIPDNCRGMAILNIQSYAAGQKVVKEGSYNDGLLEIVMIKNVHRFARAAAFPFSKLPITAQTNRIIIDVREPVHCQVDGEPWLQSEGIFQITRHQQGAILRNDMTSGMNCMSCTP